MSFLFRNLDFGIKCIIHSSFLVDVWDNMVITIWPLFLFCLVNTVRDIVDSFLRSLVIYHLGFLEDKDFSSIK